MDENSFQHMVQEHAMRMYRLAYAVLRNVEDAEDTVQEAFLGLHKSGAWKHATNSRAFFSRVAWRAAIARCRARSRHVEVPLDLAANCEHRDGWSEDTFEKAQSLTRMQTLIDSLPEKYRSPLLMLGINEFSSTEAAEVLGIPEGTVRRRAMQARSLLREKFTALYGSRR